MSGCNLRGTCRPCKEAPDCKYGYGPGESPRSTSKEPTGKLVQTEEGPRYVFPSEPDTTGHTELSAPEPQKEAPEKSPLDTQVGGDHYRSKGIQPVEYAHANKLGFFEGSVVKYVTRWRDKGGIADLEKARHFLAILIELETRNG
jgi:Protein of unknwon function (DUF3310).